MKATDFRLGCTGLEGGMNDDTEVESTLVNAQEPIERGRGAAWLRTDR